MSVISTIVDDGDVDDDHDDFVDDDDDAGGLREMEWRK